LSQGSKWFGRSIDRKFGANSRAVIYPCPIPISKVDASTSCIDLIDESCSPSWNENVVVETCDSLIGNKNDELKQEVKWLRERLASLMGKGKNNEEQVDISQDMKNNVQPS
jgi:hypothetical protein